MITTFSYTHFRLPFALNIEYEGIWPIAAHAILGFNDPAHTIWWVDETFLLLHVKPDIVGVAGCQHAAGSFCLPQLLSKEREHCI